MGCWCIKAICSDDMHHVARAWIHIGALQYRLLLPRSPIDPGERAQLKTKAYSREMKLLEAQKRVQIWQRRATDGGSAVSASKEESVYGTILSSMVFYNEKIARSRSKRVHRPSAITDAYTQVGVREDPHRQAFSALAECQADHSLCRISRRPAKSF